MKKNKLSLPLEYNKLHKFYDVLSSDHANIKNRLLEKILRKNKVKTVLDLTCGTGSQIIWLAQHNFQVTGSDISPALLNIAKEKVKQLKLKVKLVKGDMRSKKMGKFDAVITIFNAIGHLTKADFEKTIKNINKNLKKDGLYVFDIFNLDTMTDKVVKNLAMNLKKTVNGVEICNIQYSTINKKSGFLTSYDRFIIQKDSAKPKIFKGKFKLQIYTAKELREMLAKNGFETVGQYGMDGKKFLEDKTISILTVAKKK